MDQALLRNASVGSASRATCPASCAELPKDRLACPDGIWGELQLELLPIDLRCRRRRARRRHEMIRDGRVDEAHGRRSELAVDRMVAVDVRLLESLKGSIFLPRASRISPSCTSTVPDPSASSSGTLRKYQRPSVCYCREHGRAGETRPDPTPSPRLWMPHARTVGGGGTHLRWRGCGLRGGCAGILAAMALARHRVCCRVSGIMGKVRRECGGKMHPSWLASVFLPSATAARTPQAQRDIQLIV